MNFGDLPRASRGFLVSVATLAVFVFGVFSAPQPVHADPHGIFFTVVGQQQLFFNVLAALDQADYVEPKQLRDALLADRTETGFGEENDDRSEVTETDLASILTRSVTLEGADLWTQYVIRQEALEQRRIRDADRLYRLVCEVGLGIIGCSDHYLAQHQDSVYVENPVNEAQEIVDAQRLALDSGSGADQELRKKFSQGKTDYATVPWDALAAYARAASTGIGRVALESLAQNTYNTGGEGGVDGALLRDVEVVDQFGTIGVKGMDSTQQWMENMQRILGLPVGFMATARKAGEQALAHAATNVDGMKPITRPIPETQAKRSLGNNLSQPELNTSGESRVSVPAKVRSEIGADLGAELLVEGTKRESVPVEAGAGADGTQQLVNAPADDGGGGQGAVQGTQVSSENSGNGKVAGIFNELSGQYPELYDYYSQQQEALNPNDPNRAAFSDGELAFLKKAEVLKNHPRQAELASCGFCTQVRDFLTGYYGYICQEFGICSPND